LASRYRNRADRQGGQARFFLGPNVIDLFLGPNVIDRVGMDCTYQSTYQVQEIQ
jgi:hypothetical protein